MKADIIWMAVECGFAVIKEGKCVWLQDTDDLEPLKRIIALVRTDEREKCAKLAKAEADRVDAVHEAISEDGERHLYLTGKAVAAERIEQAIRAMKDE